MLVYFFYSGIGIRLLVLSNIPITWRKKMHLFMWCHVVLFFTAENMKIINGEDIFLGPLWISGLSRQSWRNTVYRIFSFCCPLGHMNRPQENWRKVSLANDFTGKKHMKQSIQSKIFFISFAWDWGNQTIEARSYELWTVEDKRKKKQNQTRTEEEEEQEETKYGVKYIRLGWSRVVKRTIYVA